MPLYADVICWLGNRLCSRRIVCENGVNLAKCILPALQVFGKAKILKNMLRIGLTGGIGSGKSTVARILEVLRVPVYYADVSAKKLMNADDGLKSSISAEFGSHVYKHGILDTGMLGSIVFNDEAKLTKLNSLVHPATIQDGEKWIALQTGAYAVKEAALLFESGSDKGLDYIIGVNSPVDLRIERVMRRDQVTKEQVLSRLNKQMDETEKLSRCHFVLVNDDKQLLLPQVLELHNKLLKLSA